MSLPISGTLASADGRKITMQTLESQGDLATGVQTYLLLPSCS